MFNPHRLILLVPILLLAGVTIACDSEGGMEEPPPLTPTTGVIQGRVVLPVGASGGVENTRVAVYTSFEDWNRDRTLRTVSTDANGNYTMADLAPGSYYIDAWKDNDNSRGLSTGDFFGVYISTGSLTLSSDPSPVEVRAAETITLDINLLIW